MTSLTVQQDASCNPQCGPEGGCVSDDNSPAARLRGLSFVVRSDLQVTRQLHRGEAVYVVHDPVSFRTHRLSLDNYRIFVRLNQTCSIGENFDQLVRQRHLSAEDQEFYYQLIGQLHQLGIIVLPVASGARLFDQFQKQQSQRFRGRLTGFLFLRIPVAHPDAFLARTVNQVRFLFSPVFFVLWMISGLAAAGLVFSRIRDFGMPLNSILATENLPFLWLSFVGLKIWHELGHGYACRAFGGAVPEMGLMLIVGTPAAYMDATAAWSFPERRKRLIVMLGGMYFESLIAIPAVFVWAFSSSPMLSSCAYQLVLMSSVITVLFNANPLMKYDGYFITGELLGIQNLRSRSDLLIRGFLKRLFLGIESPSATSSLRETVILASYGIASSIYRFFLVIGIAVMIAQRFPLIGIAIAGFQLSSTVFGSAFALGRYLLADSQTAPVRRRAVLIAVLALIVFPCSLLVVPMPFGVVTQGVVAAQTEYYLNAETPGNLIDSAVLPGDHVEAGKVIARLENDDVADRYQLTRATLQEVLLRWDITQNRSVAEAARHEPEIRELKHQLLELQRQMSGLQASAPGPGVIARVLPNERRGQFVRVGETVAIVINGKPLLRTWLSEDQLGNIRRDTGTQMEFRIPGRSGQTHFARITRIEPASELASLNQALTFLAGGEIILNPSTGLPRDPLFQVDLEPTEESILNLSSHGTRISLNLPRRYVPVASWMLQKVIRFVNRTLMA